MLPISTARYPACPLSLQVAESVGVAGKLTGSGGAVVALCPEGAAQERRLVEACRKEGLECVKAVPGPIAIEAT